MNNLRKFFEIFFGLLLFSLFFVFFLYEILKIIDVKMEINDWILFLTFLALLGYFWETRGMKKEMIKQNDILTKPELVFYYDKNEGFCLKNVGNGNAYNIEIGKIKITDEREILFYFPDCFSFLDSKNYKKLIYKHIIKKKNGEKSPYSDDKDFLKHYFYNVEKGRIDKGNNEKEEIIRFYVYYQDVLKRKIKRNFFFISNLSDFYEEQMKGKERFEIIYNGEEYIK